MQIRKVVDMPSRIALWPFRYDFAVNIESQWQGAGDDVFNHDHEINHHLWTGTKRLAHVFHRTKVCPVLDVHVSMYLQMIKWIQVVISEHRPHTLLWVNSNIFLF